MTDPISTRTDGAPSPTADELKSVGTAVVGCGYWGRNLVRVMHGLSDLKICCDLSEGVRARLAREYRDVRIVGDVDQVLADPSVEAVVLATPARVHAELAERVLDAGKHVFVEKPLALNSDDCARVVDSAARADRILMVGHLLEYHPAVTYMKDLVDSGALGEVYYLYSRRVNLGKVRSDENALWSLAPHDLSVIMYLLGETPERVEAQGQSFLQAGIEDVVFLTLHFASGRVAHVHVSWLDPHKERRLTLVGSRKMVVFDDMETQEKVRIYDKGVDRADQPLPYESYAEILQLRSGDIEIPRIDSREPLVLECTDFLRAVRTGIPPRADGADGLAVVRVLEAAQESLRAPRAVPWGGA